MKRLSIYHFCSHFYFTFAFVHLSDKRHRVRRLKMVPHCQLNHYNPHDPTSRARCTHSGRGKTGKSALIVSHNYWSLFNCTATESLSDPTVRHTGLIPPAYKQPDKAVDLCTARSQQKARSS